MTKTHLLNAYTFIFTTPNAPLNSKKSQKVQNLGQIPFSDSKIHKYNLGYCQNFPFSLFSDRHREPTVSGVQFPRLIPLRFHHFSIAFLQNQYPEQFSSAKPRG
uniref:Uncharacterized protein n=1 Tax=Cucumis melo TaxID=3656 RepID=A0A9I9EGG0_CUCME